MKELGNPDSCRNRLAVFFPGIGYTVDKPLMHYCRRIASDAGYKVKLLPYSGFPEKVKGDQNRMEKSFQLALEQSVRMLSDTDLSVYDDVLFVGKSIGTIVAAKLASDSPVKDRIRHVLYTPLKETFSFSIKEALVFTGSADPWVHGPGQIPHICIDKGIPCHVIEDANHSLETGNVEKDIMNMLFIMTLTERFVKENAHEI